MAPTLKFYNPNWILKFSQTIGAAANIKGIYFDGFFFWVLEEDGIGGTFLSQYYLNSAGTFSQVSTVDISNIIPLGVNDTLDYFISITGAGLNLYIGYRLSVSDGGIPPTVITYSKIAHITKRGTLLRANIATVNFLIEGDYTDLTWDGARLVAVTGAGSVRYLKWIDVSLTGGAIVNRLSLVRAQAGIAFNGVNFFVSRNGTGQGATIDVNGTFLTPNVATGISPKGMDFGTEELALEGFADFFDSEWIVLAHN